MLGPGKTLGYYLVVKYYLMWLYGLWNGVSL
jgi:hypothetical protein